MPYSTTPLVGEPNLEDLPRYVDRKRGANLISHYFFVVSPRSLERWPVNGRVINGRKMMPTADLLAAARAKMAAA